MGHQGRTVEHVLAAIAGRQHGVVTRRQLLEAGISAKEVVVRLRRGTLIPVHRGVYRVGHRAPNDEATYMAAVLACGTGAVLGGQAAGHLFGIAMRRRAPGAEVMAPTERRVAGVRVHRARTLDRRDTTVWRGIPVTTVARTLVDLAATLGDEELKRSCHEADVRFRITPAHVDHVLDRWANAPGSRRLRRVLHGDADVTLSTIERRFRELVVAEGLPLPQMNRVASARRVDCRWPEHRMTVELDSYTYHRTRHAWERDRRREREAFARGDSIRRYTRDDILVDPAAMLAELHEIFRRPS
jgi:predicted transcriptional regulator of viral defense system